MIRRTDLTPVPRRSSPGGIQVPQLVSLRELAEKFSCDRSTVARRLAAAGIRPVVFNQSRTGLKRYALEDVLAFLRDAKGPATPALHPTGRR